MKKVVFLLSHIPNPRMTKRINLNLKDIQKYLIYQSNNNACNLYTLNSNVEIKEIKMKKNEKMKNFPHFFKEAINHLKNIKPKYIYLGNMDMLIIGVFYKKLYDKNIKIFYEIADLTDTYNKSIPKKFALKIGRYLERKMLKDVDKLILTSDYFWKNYYSKFMNSEKYLYIPNCPEKRIFQNLQHMDSEFFRIGFIGNVRYEKTFYSLIDALEELKERKVKFIISGRGQKLEEIVAYAKNKGVLIELTGEYNYEIDIKKIYENIDCVYSLYDTLSPNVRIALPNKLYEAIVSSKPLIVSKNTYLGEIVTKLGIGEVCNIDKNEIKQAILNLTTEKIYLKYVKNIKKIKEEYYFENYNQKLEAIFKEKELNNVN